MKERIPKPLILREKDKHTHTPREEKEHSNLSNSVVSHILSFT